MKKLAERLLSAVLAIVLMTEGMIFPVHAMESEEASQLTETVETVENRESVVDMADIIMESEEREESEEKSGQYPKESSQIIFINDTVTICYGEDGSNKEGNLDHLFLPLIKNEDLGEIEGVPTYRFFSENSLIYRVAQNKDSLTQEQLRELLKEEEGETLSKLKAGSKVITALLLPEEEACYLVQGEVIKRGISLLGRKDSLLIDKNRLKGVNIYEITPEMEEYEAFQLEVEETGFTRGDELESLSEAVNGNLILELDNITEEETVANLYASLTEGLKENYYIKKDSFINVIMEKSVSGNELEQVPGEPEILKEEQPAINPKKESISQNTAQAEISFTLNPSSIMYGESGNNENGTLDDLLQPVYVIDQEEYYPESENKIKEEEEQVYQTSYKFVTEKEKLRNLTVQSFEELEGENLSVIPAGEVVYVAAKATAKNQPDVITTDSFIMEKRKVLLHFEAPKEEAINEKSVLEENLIFEKEEAKEYLTVEVVENPYNEEGVSTFSVSENQLLTEELLAGEITLDISQIDYEEIGYQTAPMTLEVAPQKADNYQIIVDVVGYIYVEETTFFITFTVKNNGKRKEVKYVLDQEYLSQDRTITEVLTHLGKLSEVYPNMGGFLENEEEAAIIGWNICKDANRWGTFLSSEFYYYYEEEEYQLTKRADYYLTANLCKKSTENIYIDAIPAVTYDGRAHVVGYESYSATQNPDLNVWVKYVGDDESIDEGIYLRYGKDYKVSYKNNKAVSVTINEKGEYVSLYQEGVDDKKRPCAIITGIGSYKGFSATVYFDILPLNIGNDPVAKISGLKNSYVLGAKGRINGTIAPKVKVTHQYYNGKKYVNKTENLKLGKDYIQKLYIYEDNRWKECEESAPSKVTKEGKYLYTVRGIGNYCGTAFGQEYAEVFNDGAEGDMNPRVSSYVGTDIANCQFIVIGDASQDLAKANITVKKTQLKYKRNTYYTGADFGVTVTIGKGADRRVLTEGVDYYLTFDGTDFEYVAGKNSDGSYHLEMSSEIYEGDRGNNAKITIANKYEVTITAIEGNDNGIFGFKKGKSVRIKGIKIEPSWFKLSTPTLKYNGRNSGSGIFETSYKRNMKVVIKTVDAVLSFNSNGLSDFQARKNNLSDNTVFLFYDGYNKDPGTYERSIIPVGPGVDHDREVVVKFKRVGITTKEAVKKGLLKISCEAADYNVAGALPKDIVITLNGVENYCGDMQYNGQTFTVNDWQAGMYGWPTSVTLKLTVSNNKKPGNSASLFIQGDGKVFKGKSGKFIYSVSPITISDTEIPVLTSDTYLKDFGKITQTVERDGFYAKYEPVAKPVSGMPKYKITLYQTYYKNEQDYYSERRSLAKLSNSQYKLTLTPDGSNGYQVDVGNSKAKIITGYDFKEVSIAENYTVFDKAATISQAIVTVNGKEYNYPTDAKLPITFTGGQIRFDKNQGDGVSQVVLKDGTVLDADNFYVEYGDNVAAGKGSFTVILKRNSEGDYPYGGKATFNFTIGNAANVVL